MATVTGKLQDVLTVVEEGSVEIALCGWGGRVPRDNGVALCGRPTSNSIPVQSNGTFTATVAGNDQISPAGTYYTVTVKNSNGDVVQVNAYQFNGSGTYDLNLTDPYDPNQPPPPLPPLITNLLEIIGATGNMVFDGTIYTAFKTTLPGDVTAPVFQNMMPGNLYTFIIIQDATGGHAFAWAANVNNATLVCPTANSTTVQTFVADDKEALWAISPGTWSP